MEKPSLVYIYKHVHQGRSKSAKLRVKRNHNGRRKYNQKFTPCFNLPIPSPRPHNPHVPFRKTLSLQRHQNHLSHHRLHLQSFFPNPCSTTSTDLETISDGFDEGGSNQAPSTKIYLQTFCSVGSNSLATLIKKLVDTGDRPVLVYDGFLRWALDVAKQFGIPSAVFFTQSCAVNNVYYHVSKGILQLPLLPEVNVSLPGLPLLQVSELPSFISDYEPQSAWFDVIVKQFENVDGADWVVFNIFYELEEVCPFLILLLLLRINFEYYSGLKLK
ncbi:hypothetical protein Golob_019457 [Gossypium lobatum]|uniref:Uncharacterized protein n=1 Tax=Gossypium lobatum TaxID=34289 RepID=A0A7J8L7C3_9ROSI|nr:hypothetical protein [Gossypium lobatum]